MLRLLYIVRLTLCLLLAGCSLGQTAAAQNVSPVVGNGEGSTAELMDNAMLPDELTREKIREVLSSISDQQARELLLRELDRRIAESEQKTADNRPLTVVLSGWGHDLVESWLKVAAAAPNIAKNVAGGIANLLSSREGRGLWQLPLTIILCLGIGAILAGLVRRHLIQHYPGQPSDKTAPMWSKLSLIGSRLFKRLIVLAIFTTSAIIANVIINGQSSTDSAVILYFITAISWAAFAVVAARMVLSPTDAALRICALSDRSATFLTNRIGVIFGISAIGFGFIQLLSNFGVPLGEAKLGFWIAAAVYFLIALTIWQARHAITAMIVSHTHGHSVWKRVAEIWPVVAIGIVALQWLIVELFVATGNLESLSFAAMNVSLVLVLAFPMIEPIVRGFVEGIWPDDPTQDSALRAAHVQTQAGLVRCGRIAMAVAIIVALAWMWGLNLADLASQGVGAQLAGAAVEISLIVIFAYGLWELINIIADRQIAMDRVMLGIDPDSEEELGGEGGVGGSRLGTLVPLLRGTGKVAVIVVATLSALGQMGVNVTPLLAGAGIVGLAIGFGAQTLVKDIISGLFFLIDDAFRKGEYIDIGTVKGTVEKISVRSMQLRHHNGPLNTVPFGEITHLTNFSRDWVMMKLPLRVTYDTDVDKMRKLIKKLGQELLEDPELGPKFLQPLKSQGVIQMEDSAMITRIKFMTKPGDQWTLRTQILARLRSLFEREGIKFAHREVTVRIAERDSGEPLNEVETAAATAAARSVVENVGNEKLVDR